MNGGGSAHVRYRPTETMEMDQNYSVTVISTNVAGFFASNGPKCNLRLFNEFGHLLSSKQTYAIDFIVQKNPSSYVSSYMW